MRYAPAYRKQPSLRALGFEKCAWHTRLEAVFALYFHHKGAFFASQKTGLSAIMKTLCVFIPPQSLSRKAQRLRVER
jgi:hypothetical protein